MNARPRFPYADQDETLLTLARWHRQSEALLLSRLYGAPEAGEEIEDTAPEAPEPYVMSERQEAAEYHYDAESFDLSDDREALASAGIEEGE